MLYQIFKLYKNHYDFWRNNNNTPAQKLQEQTETEKALQDIEANLPQEIKRFIDPSRVAWVAKGGKAY